MGNYTTPDGTPLKTAFTVMTERYMSEEYSPEMASKVCGVPAKQIEKVALEMAHVAFKETIEVLLNDRLGNPQNLIKLAKDELIYKLETHLSEPIFLS